MQPAGQDPEDALRARNAHSTALFAYECQSFLDNLIAGLGRSGAWNDPVSERARFKRCQDSVIFWRSIFVWIPRPLGSGSAFRERPVVKSRRPTHPGDPISPRFTKNGNYFRFSIRGFPAHANTGDPNGPFEA
jgi:hypothetical protein